MRRKRIRKINKISTKRQERKKKKEGSKKERMNKKRAERKKESKQGRKKEKKEYPPNENNFESERKRNGSVNLLRIHIISALSGPDLTTLISKSTLTPKCNNT